MNWNSYDFIDCNGFNFSELCSVIDPIEFLNFSDIPYENIKIMGERGLSEIDILKFYGWEVLQ